MRWSSTRCNNCRYQGTVNEVDRYICGPDLYLVMIAEGDEYSWSPDSPEHRPEWCDNIWDNLIDKAQAMKALGAWNEKS